MLVELRSVVRGDHDHCVVEKAAILQLAEDEPQLFVDASDLGVVQRLEQVNFCR